MTWEFGQDFLLRLLYLLIPIKGQKLSNRTLLFDAKAFEKKNHDYGEAWRDMRLKSLTDLILVKVLRIKQIEDNDGRTLISEGVDSNLYDMINYAVFALIKLAEKE